MTFKPLFGRYIEGTSPIHRLDPRAKLLLMFALVVIIFLASNWIALAFVGICICSISLLTKIQPLQLLRSIAPLLFIVVFTLLANVVFIQTGEILLDWGWLRITSGGLNLGAFVGIRLILLLFVGSLLTMTTTSIDLTQACECLLKPLARIGFPAHEFSFVMSTALRFLPQFADEFQIIRLAQISRGAKLYSSPLRGTAAITSLLVPLFASVFRRADTLSLAMDARCFSGTYKRSRLRTLKFSRLDFVALFCTAFAGAITFLFSSYF